MSDEPYELVRSRRTRDQICHAETPLDVYLAADAFPYSVYNAVREPGTVFEGIRSVLVRPAVKYGREERARQEAVGSMYQDCVQTCLDTTLRSIGIRLDYGVDVIQ